MADAVGKTFEVLKDKLAVGIRAAKLLFEIATIAIQQRGQFTVAFSGGSFPKNLGNGIETLDGEGAITDEMKAGMANWFVLFADERCVPHESDDSSFKACKTLLFDKALSKIPAENILAIHPDSEHLDGDAIVADYISKLKSSCGEESVVDLVFLGMGPDGHTASLFPGHELLQSKNDIDFIGDSPKPPPRRVTMTLPLINRARNKVFVVTGSSKVEVVTKIQGGSTEFPAGMIQEAVWLLDEDAGKELSGANVKSEL